MGLSMATHPVSPLGPAQPVGPPQGLTREHLIQEIKRFAEESAVFFYGGLCLSDRG